MCRGYSKPWVKFLKEPHLVVGYKENRLTYFVGVYNEIPTGRLQGICKRRIAISSKVKVEFSIEGKFLTDTTWWDSELGENLAPDSKVHEFPLVSVKAGIDTPHGEEEVFLEGTSASTATKIPILKIPLDCHIMAKVSVVSPSLKEPAVSEWDIAIMPSFFSPVGVKRLR